MRMLVADDDYGTRLLLKNILTKKGEIDVAVNGFEVFDAFQLAWKDNEPYDIIWLDIMMPGKDGHSVLQEIYKYEKEIGLNDLDCVNIVIISALNDPQNIMSAFKSFNVKDYIVKPLLKNNVLAVLNKVMKNG